MMRKSAVALMIVISGLMFYAGCDDNDGGGGGSDPCADLAAVAECPCDYFKVPMTTDCWGGEFCSCENIDFTPCESSQCDLLPDDDGCELSEPVGEGARFANTAIRGGDGLSCSVGFTLGNIAPSCNVQEIKNVTSEAQFETCLCRLAQYTTELAQKNIVQIDPAQASYSCESSPTPPAPMTTPTPTPTPTGCCEYGDTDPGQCVDGITQTECVETYDGGFYPNSSCQEGVGGVCI